MLKVMISFHGQKGEDEVFFVNFKNHLEDADECTKFIENMEYVRSMSLDNFKKYMMVASLLDANEDDDIDNIINHTNNISITTDVLDAVVKLDKHEYCLKDLKLK